MGRIRRSLHFGGKPYTPPPTTQTTESPAPAQPQDPQNVTRYDPAAPRRILSFGYKHGHSPAPACVVDVRAWFPDNPWRVLKLREQTGLDPEVAAFMQASPEFEVKYTKLKQLARSVATGRTLALGCLGGRHRSVYVADRLARELGVPVEHRDVTKR